jgi:hypothetical protein
MPDDIYPMPETDHGKAIAAGMTKVSAAENETFSARIEAINASLDDARSHDVLLICAYVLSEVAQRVAKIVRANSRPIFSRL